MAQNKKNTYRETLVHWYTQRATALFLIPTLLIANVKTLICLNLVLFWHFRIGLEEILADYIHHDITRNVIYIFLRALILITMKYAFCLFVYT